MKKFIQLYKRFERFWHWLQAFLVLTLMITGFEQHGLISIFGFRYAAYIHNACFFAWGFLYIMIMTWIMTTGEWKQFIPSFKGMDKVFRFYSYGVFLGEKHPHHTTPQEKFNPMQKMGYIVILFAILPVQFVTGYLFFFFPELRELGIIARIDLVAYIHTFMAYTLCSFVIIHLYMITMGDKLTSHLKAMLTGKDEIED